MHVPTTFAALAAILSAHAVLVGAANGTDESEQLASSIVLGLLSVQAANVNVCAAGTEAIPNREQCAAAAAMLGKSYEGTESIEWRPKGCFVSGSALVFFNVHPNGLPNYKTRPICAVQEISGPSNDSWVLIHSDAYCTSSVHKRLAEEEATVALCKSLTKADPECGNQMYSNGDMCRCVRAGLVCDFKASGTGNNVYELGAATTIAPITTTAFFSSTLDARIASEMHVEEQSTTPASAGTMIANDTDFSTRHRVQGIIKVRTPDPAAFVSDSGVRSAVLGMLALVTQQPVYAITLRMNLDSRRLESIDKLALRRLEGVAIILCSVLVDNAYAEYIAGNLEDVYGLQLVLRQKLKAVGYVAAESTDIFEATSDFSGGGFAAFGVVNAHCCPKSSFSVVLASVLGIAALLLA